MAFTPSFIGSILLLSTAGHCAVAAETQSSNSPTGAGAFSPVSSTVPASIISAPVSVFPNIVPRSPIEIESPVTSVNGAELSLSSGSRQRLIAGMILNLLDESGNVVGKARLNSLTASTSQATILGSLPVGSAVKNAVIPAPLPLTSIENDTVYFVLPRGSRQLKTGDPLTVIRDGQAIASLEFKGYSPISASLKGLRPGVQLQENDIAWAVSYADFKANTPLVPFDLATSSATGNSGGSSGIIPGTSTPSNEATKRYTTVTSSAQVNSNGSAPNEEKVKSLKDAINRSHALWLSRSGGTGLIRMPSADTTAEGEVRVMGIFSDTLTSTQDPNLARIGGGTKYTSSVGFLPGVEFGLVVGSDQASRDLNINAKVQFLRETNKLPALALGVAEYKKLAGQTLSQNYDTTYYLAGSKSLLNQRVRATLGVASQSDIKPFGGVEVSLTPYLGAVVEHDGDDLNYGVRASFLNNRLQVGANHITTGWYYQAGFNLPFSTRRSPASNATLPQLGQSLTLDQAIKGIQNRLVKVGLENVRVRVLGADSASNTLGGDLGNRLEVSYENRSFPHNEIDALAYVFATAAVYAPPQIVRTDVIVRRASLDLLHVAAPLDKYRSFVAGELSSTDFSNLLIVDYPSGNESGVRFSSLVATDVAATPYGKADLSFRPRLRTALATESYVLGLGFGIQPELDVPIARGVGLNIQGDIPVAGPLQGNKAQFNRVGLRLVSRPSASILLGGFLGRFADERSVAPRNAGIAQAAWRSGNGKLIARASAGLVEERDGGGKNTTYTGEATYYFAPLDLSARASAGRYIDGDKGFTLGLMRRYGDTELGLEARDTDRGRAGIFKLAIPIGPDHLSDQPSRLRVRSADFFEYSLRSLLTSPNFVSVARRTGNELDLGPDLQTLLDRDRLTPAYVLRSIDQLKNVRDYRFSPVSTTTEVNQ